MPIDSETQTVRSIAVDLLHDARVVKQNLMRFRIVLLGLRGTCRARSARHDCHVGLWMSEQRRARACLLLRRDQIPRTPRHHRRLRRRWRKAPRARQSVRCAATLCAAVMETTFGVVVDLRHPQAASRRIRHRLTGRCAGRPPSTCAASARAPPPRMLFVTYGDITVAAPALEGANVTSQAELLSTAQLEHNIAGRLPRL